MQYLFTAQVVNICNRLPDYTVDSDSMNTSKCRFWQVTDLLTTCHRPRLRQIFVEDLTSLI